MMGRLALSEAFAKRYLNDFLPNYISDVRHKQYIDKEKLIGQHGKTFVRMLDKHNALGAGEFGVVIESQIPNRVIKMQIPNQSRKLNVYDEVDAMAKAGDIGLAPEIYSVETYPGGGSAIEMEKVPINPELKSDKRNLLTAQAGLDLINHGVNHNDVHPENVSYDPITNTIKFIDFGVSKINPSEFSEIIDRRYSISEGMQALGLNDENKILNDMVMDLMIAKKKSSLEEEKASLANEIFNLLRKGEDIVQSGSID